jgi:hypothetical protein
MIKARHTLIYVIILAAIGGYFYYFEMLKPHQKQQAEQVARKVFQFSIDQVNALEILPRGKPPVRLAKEIRWRISEPITADVDETSLNGMLNALQGLQRDRQVVENSDDLKIFGLQEPGLTLRFKSGDTWHELIIGDLNPVGDTHYAKIGDRSAVFLMARGNWSIFDKGAKDLRRRQLFTFEPQAVKAMEINWQRGEHFTVTKDGTGVWKSADQADKVIKKSKVDHVLDQIQWLRARDFLAESTADLKLWELDPPYVTVKLQLNEGQDATLELAQEDQGNKQAAAVASQLGGVVRVEGEILKQLPKDLRSLEDRSLLAFRTDQVKQVIWKFGPRQGHLVQADGSKWVWKLSDGKERELAQSWQVRSLLWELDDAEYEQRDSAASAPPSEAQGYVEFWGSQDKLGAIGWEEPKSAESATVRMWLMPGNGANPLAVQAKAEIMQKMEQKLEELDKSQSQ